MIYSKCIVDYTTTSRGMKYGNPATNLLAENRPRWVGAHLFILFSWCLWTYLNVCVFVSYHQLQVTEGSGPRGMIKRFLGLPPPLPPPPCNQNRTRGFHEFYHSFVIKNLDRILIIINLLHGVGGRGYKTICYTVSFFVSREENPSSITHTAALRRVGECVSTNCTARSTYMLNPPRGGGFSCPPFHKAKSQAHSSARIAAEKSRGCLKSSSSPCALFFLYWEYWRHRINNK